MPSRPWVTAEDRTRAFPRPSPRVLVVEDDPSDVFLIESALELSGIEAALTVAGNGREALIWLERESARAGPAWPDAVLLDLNMPLLDEYELLERLRAHAAFALLLVLVLTTSNAPEDVRRAYALGADAFVSRPVDLDGVVGFFQRLGPTGWVAPCRAPTSLAVRTGRTCGSPTTR